MNGDSQKVTANHLKRDAYLYVRQSTLRQVIENTESTQRQYALKQRAVALGWPAERIVVIDNDQGQSGASAADREGFQRLVADVGMGRAGIVLGLEVSRLARNSSDWHRLLEICALSDTLILDEDGLYDSSHFNDRLLLGLKGAMSELHVLRARLQGGLMNKARRGELRFILPVGLIYDVRDRVTLDPDQQVQQAFRTFFQAYEQTGSACRVVKFFKQQGLVFPRRLRRGARKGELIWGPLGHNRALQVLHNPRYAGAFVWGRYRVARCGWPRGPQRLSPDEWQVVIPEAHAGYISWDTYQRNLRRLHESAQARGLDRRQSPSGEGPALLQGLAMCGLCGKRMTLRYHQRRERLVPTYICQREGIERGEPLCQTVPGGPIDDAISEMLLEAMTPVALNIALAVQQELDQRIEEVDRLRRQQIERARYEAELAQRRFMQVDPGNRLVADTLESDWNDKLRMLADAQEQYRQQQQADRLLFDAQQRQQIFSLTTDLPRLWRDPKTPDRERKRIVRLLLDDVTLIKADRVTAHVRFRGGATRTLSLPRPLLACDVRRTSQEVVVEIDRLLNEHTCAEIADVLNKRGFHPGAAGRFTARIVARLRRCYGLKDRYTRLRATGKLTLGELAKQLDVRETTVKIWRRAGLLKAHPYNDKNECLYDPLDGAAPRKQQGTKLSERRLFDTIDTDRTNEVHHAT